VRALAGKTAVVTGAASGIGFATAAALAARGVHLVLLDVDAALLETARTELAASGVNVHCRAVDIADRVAVRGAAAAMEAALGPIHILFSNAGVADAGGPIEDTPDETFDWIMSVNVGGMFNAIKAFLPAMKQHGAEAHVVLTASIVALHEQPGRPNGVYGASKMAVFGLAEGLRASLAGRIGVSVLVPGAVVTNLRQSGRLRPPRYGGPFERPDAARAHGGMTAGEVGRIIVRAIEENEFLIVTHPAGRDYIKARCDELLAAFDRWSAMLPELDIDPSQLPFLNVPPGIL
jgi:NAD(P)-dependent dehydrogenase (short-subunit alcohol dehydrogenase family)